MAAAIKMDELLVSWIGSDSVYENVLELMEQYSKTSTTSTTSASGTQQSPKRPEQPDPEEASSHTSPREVIIPPFYPLQHGGKRFPKRKTPPRPSDSWDPLPATSNTNSTTTTASGQKTTDFANTMEEDPTMNEDEDEQQGIEAPSGLNNLPSNLCVRDHVNIIFREHAEDDAPNVLPLAAFVRITKEVCRFPSFFNPPLYARILDLYNSEHSCEEQVISLEILEWYWKTEMEPYDDAERFFRLLKQPSADCIVRNDFLPYINALLNDHPVSTYIHTYHTYHLKIMFLVKNLFAHSSHFHQIQSTLLTYIYIGPRILGKSRRVSRQVCRDCHYAHLLFGQSVSLGSHHLTTNSTLRFARGVCHGR